MTCLSRTSAAPTWRTRHELRVAAPIASIMKRSSHVGRSIIGMHNSFSVTFLMAILPSHYKKESGACYSSAHRCSPPPHLLLRLDVGRIALLSLLLNAGKNIVEVAEERLVVLRIPVLLLLEDVR